MANSLIMGFDGNSCFTGFVSTSQAYFNINQLGNSGAIYGSTGNENYCSNDARWSILSRSSENIGEIIDQNKEITKPTTGYQKLRRSGNRIAFPITAFIVPVIILSTLRVLVALIVLP